MGPGNTHKDERFSGSRNSVPVHSNDDHSGEVFAVLKPLGIQLQKRDSDIYKAYTQVTSVKSDLKAIRKQTEVHFNRWYEASVELGKDVDVEPALQELPTDSGIVITFQLPHLFSTFNVHCAFH